MKSVEPGYKTWLIEPQTGDLSWAEGTVPTPYGQMAKDFQWFEPGDRRAGRDKQYRWRANVF
jgi:alpha-L-rhamnosidase-like protein